MKTLDFDAGPDEILEEVDVNGETFVRVRRKVAFLGPPFTAKRISTVSSPANQMPFAALKADDDPATDAATKERGPGGHEADGSGPPPHGRGAGPGAGLRDGSGIDKECSVDTDKEEGAVDTKPAAAAKAPGILAQIASVLKGQGWIVQEPTEATKRGEPATDVAQTIARRDWREKWWDLRWAFDDVVYDLMFSDEIEGDRAALLQKAVADFATGATALMAQRPMLGLKAVDASDVPDDEWAGMGPAVKAVAQKAGRMISAGNLAQLKAASNALQGILTASDAAEQKKAEAKAKAAEAASAAAASAAKEEGEDGDDTTKVHAAASAAPSKQTDNEPPVEGAKERAMDAQKSAAALQALEAVKAATTDEERAAALKAAEMAIKGEPAPLTMEGLKETMAAAAAEAAEKAVAPLLDALKAIPGLDLPGDESAAGATFNAVDNPLADPAAQGRVMFPASPGPGPIQPLNTMTADGGGPPYGVAGARKGQQPDVGAMVRAELARVLLATDGTGQPATGRAALKADDDGADTILGIG